MNILVIALAAWGTFALLRLVVVPRADRRADDNRNSSGVRAAAWSSLSGFLSFASLMVAISTTAALSVLAYVNATGGTTLQDARDALGQIDRIDAFFSNLDARVGIATTIVLILAFAYHAYRSGGLRLRSCLKEHIDQELSRLASEDLEELPPTREMENLAAEIGAWQYHLAELHETDLAREQLLARIQELVAQYQTVDLLRRVDTNLNEPEAEVESALGRVLLFFSSAGMVRSLTGLGRVTVAVGLLLLLPTSMTIGLPAIQDATTARRLALNERVEAFELQLYTSLMTTPVQGPLSTDDEEAIDLIASVFESEVVQERYLRGALALQASNEVVRARASTEARNLILEASASHPTARSQFVRPSSHDATGPRRPVTAYGERLRADLRDAIPRMNRAVWAEVRNKVDSYVRSFQRAPNPRDVRAMVLSDMLGNAIGGVNVDGAFAERLQWGTIELTGEMAEATYIAESQRYMVELVQSEDIGQALNSLSRIPQPMASDAMAQVRVSVDNIPAPERFSVRSNSLAVTLRQGVDEATAQRAVRRIAEIRGFQSAASAGDNLLASADIMLTSADALLSFGDLFPGQPNEPINSVRGRTVREPVPRASRTTVDSRLRAGGYRRARSYARLRGFSKVGGVLIGRPPQSGTSLEAERLDWRVSEREVVLWLIRSDGSPLEVGRYDPAIVHNALAYAADGRVTTVTMVPAAPLADLHILLHPALVDTGLGCSAIRLDQLADEASMGQDAPNQSLVEHRDTATTSVYRQHNAYLRAWAIRMLRLSYLSESLLHEDVHRNLADHATRILRASDQHPPALPVTGFDFLETKAEFYDARLVDALRSCRLSRSVGDLDGCIVASTMAELDRLDVAASWATLPPRIEAWSGVREQPWAIDEAMAFMSSDQPLGPFRFMVQIAFTTRPVFISEGDARFGSIDDETPYEITSLGGALMDEIASHAERDPGTAEVLARMAEFTHLQRLFRAVLDGQLVLTGMDLENLAELASETAPYVNRQETLRWLPRDFLPQQLEEELDSLRATRPEAALDLLGQVLDQVLDQVLELRGSLELDEQVELVKRLGQSRCPPPGGDIG